MSRPDERFHHARALLAAGDLAGCRALCEEMLRRKRGDFHALMLSADLAAATGDQRAELEFIRRAVLADPRNARARAHYGDRLVHLGELRPAIAQFERALRGEPGMPAALIGLATIQEALGSPEKARKSLAPLLARRPADPRAAAIELRLLLEEGRRDEAIALGESVRAAGHPESIPLRHALKTLAKAYEGAGRLDEAFARATEGAATAAPAWEPAFFDAIIEGTIAACSRERLAAIPRPAVPTSLPVFIVGMPRSGSTLIERSLHAHPLAHGAGEIGSVHATFGDFARRIGATEPYPACLAGMTEPQVTAYARDSIAMLRRRDPKAQRIVNKELFNWLHLGLIAVAFPEARVIHAVRDPLDLCLSCWMERLPTHACAWSSDFAHLGDYHRQHLRLMAHWREATDLAILEVAYEDLVASQEATTRRLLEFLGLPWDDACLAFHEVDRVETTLSYRQVRQPLYATSVRRADRYGARLDPLRAALGMPAWAGDA